MNVQALFDANEYVTLTDYLQRLGIKDVQTYLKAVTVEDDNNYAHIDEAVERFMKYKEENKHIATLVDSDVDGYLSSSMLRSFIHNKYGIDIQFFIHDKFPKAHGLNDREIQKELAESNVELLFIPDASANIHGNIYNKDGEQIEIIVLDHHNNVAEREDTILVSNQYSPNVVNTVGSGTLVTWHFIHKLDEKLANKYISYVFISILSDSMSLLSDENRTFVDRGIKDIHPYLEPFVDKYNKDNTPKSYAYGGIIPRFNATIRLADKQEKSDLFECLCGNQETLKKTLKTCTHYYNQQNPMCADLIENNVDIDDVNQKVLLCKINVQTPLTGLVANKLMSKYNKPIILVHDNENECAGSARCPIKLQKVLEASRKFNYAEGHDEAFGVSYQKKNEDDIKNFLYTLNLPKPIIDVVQSIDVEQLSTSMIRNFENYDYLWATNLKKPTYHIHGIKLKKDDIQVLGKTDTTIKFRVGDWDFIKFFCSHDWQEKTFIYDEMKIEVIGTLAWNEWQGAKTPQVIIDDMEVKKDELSFEDLF